jgi:Major Facilitator Superfamily
VPPNDPSIGRESLPWVIGGGAAHLAVMQVTTASDDPAIVRRTQIVDLVRAVPLGLIYPLETSVLLTIAIKEFDASGLAKGLIAAAGGLGLLVSPFITALARRLGHPVMRLAAALTVLGIIGYGLAIAGHLALLVAGSILGIASMNIVIPLITVTYERNFPTRERGKRVGWGMSVKIAVSALAGLGMGSFLNSNLERWRLVVLVGMLAMIVMVACYLAMPSEPLARVEGHNNRPWPHFHLLNTDRQLRLTLIAWMLMGFGNLMLLPLRVEYLANDRYNILASPGKITMLTVTIPAVVRLSMMPFFGWVFDRLSFFSARIMVNLLFALYIVAFFSGSSDIGLFAGAVTFGIAGACCDLMWTLWVTKFAPPDRVADYMGLHTFFTGVRAVSAPLIAFAIVEHLALTSVAIFAASLILISSAVLLPEAKAERARRALA